MEFGISPSFGMPILRNRLNPVHDTPPKVDEKRTKETQQLIYLICEVEIIESNDNVLGDDAVYCEGDYKGWLHHKCVYVRTIL